MDYGITAFDNHSRRGIDDLITQITCPLLININQKKPINNETLMHPPVDAHEFYSGVVDFRR